MKSVTILGITSTGELFTKPKNWPHQIACIFSPIVDKVCRFNDDIHIGYNDADVRYLTIKNPSSDCEEYMKDFAKQNDLQLVME